MTDILLYMAIGVNILALAFIVGALILNVCVLFGNCQQVLAKSRVSKCLCNAKSIDKITQVENASSG